MAEMVEMVMRVSEGWHELQGQKRDFVEQRLVFCDGNRDGVYRMPTKSFVLFLMHQRGRFPTRLTLVCTYASQTDCSTELCRGA